MASTGSKYFPGQFHNPAADTEEAEELNRLETQSDRDTWYDMDR